VFVLEWKRDTALEGFGARFREGRGRKVPVWKSERPADATPALHLTFCNTLLRWLWRNPLLTSPRKQGRSFAFARTACGEEHIFAGWIALPPCL
jgi:hypothetical protein